VSQISLYTFTLYIYIYPNSQSSFLQGSRALSIPGVAGICR